MYLLTVIKNGQSNPCPNARGTNSLLSELESFGFSPAGFAFVKVNGETVSVSSLSTIFPSGDTTVDFAVSKAVEGGHN